MSLTPPGQDFDEAPLEPVPIECRGSVERHSKPRLKFSGGHLHPAGKRDIEDVLHVLRLLHVRRYLSDGRIVSREEVASLLDESAQLEARGLGLWIISTNYDATACLAALEPGRGASRTAPPGAGSYVLFIALDLAFLGRGLATKALAALASYAGGGHFTSRGSVRRPINQIWPYNECCGAPDFPSEERCRGLSTNVCTKTLRWLMRTCVQIEGVTKARTPTVRR